jgi:hypothetical protein
MSKKRASPGAETSKNGDPLADVEIGEAEAKILNEVQHDIQRVELILGACALSRLRYPPVPPPAVQA